MSTVPKSEPINYFPNELELTDKIFDIFNRHSETIANCWDVTGNIPYAASQRKSHELGGYSRLYGKERHRDPSNLVAELTGLYSQLPETRKLLLKPVVEELKDAVAEEKIRRPESWDKDMSTSRDMIVLFRSRADVTALLDVNGKQNERQ